jgi:diguanylate cyclase (GGDEF)-like protein
MRTLLNKIAEITKSINPWHFLWISVIVSEVLTNSISSALCYLIWRKAPSREILVIGAIDALLVPFVLTPIIIVVTSHISKLQQELKSRKEAETQIRTLAYYDSLTSLPNRTLFRELLERAITYSHENNFMMALLFIDLDYFKRINDTLGHHAGDALLQDVTIRLLKAVRISDYMVRPDANDMSNVLSRLGGDEFILLLHNLSNVEDAGKVANRILGDLSMPFTLNRREVFISASIGISLYPNDGMNADDMLKNADVAMYHAKIKGRNNLQYYTKSMTDAAMEALVLEGKLRRAVENNEFELHYQMKYSFSGGAIIGMEALLRWKNAEDGVVSPAQFIPLAEETGLIVPIGRWVLIEACRQNKIWHDQYHQPFVMSVNVSSRQFDAKNLIDDVVHALSVSDLGPYSLELEITESSIMQDPEEAIRTLHKLKSMGVQISIDDFGTGYSSLNYLKRIPLDYLKIDRSFVMNIEKSTSDQAIIKAIIAMAHSMDIKIIAEGVETREQLEFLRQCGCEATQGFLHHRPQPAHEVSKSLSYNAAIIG